MGDLMFDNNEIFHIVLNMVNLRSEKYAIFLVNTQDYER